MIKVPCFVIYKDKKYTKEEFQAFLESGENHLDLYNLYKTSAEDRVEAVKGEEVTPAKVQEPIQEEVVQKEPVSLLKSEELKDKESEHKVKIEQKFRDVFKKKGVTEDQVEGGLALLQARANAWAKEEAGRTPEQYYQRISDIKGEDFVEGTTPKLYQLPDGRQVMGMPMPEVTNGFYSPIEKRLLEFKQEKASVNKWKEIIGKGDEATFTGVMDWLNSIKPNETLSKAEINQFMKDNRIEVVEVVKGKERGLNEKEIVEYDRLGGKIDALEKRRSEILDKYKGRQEEYTPEVRQEYQDIKWEIDNLMPRWEYLKQKDETERDQTKFSQYQLPGEKENYKEVLVTMPGKRISDFDKWYSMREDEYYDREEAMMAYERSVAGKIEPEFATMFQSSHFDEPNILVHLRMNTRTDSEGNKVLFLEEIQSDFAQSGRKEGFRDEKAIQQAKDDIKKADEEFQALYNDPNISYFLDLWGYNNITGKFRNQLWDSGERNLHDKINAVIEKQKSASERFDEVTKAKIPQAPFVTDTNAWVKLGLKTALKEAIKQGVDRIAWTTGEQQNERYDLSKVVDELLYYRNRNDGTYELLAYKDGVLALEQERVNENKLEDYVGKEVAQRIINKEGEEKVIHGQQGRVLKGGNLKVGGKGMIGFYGSPQESKLGIVGNIAKSLFKQEPKITKIASDVDAIEKSEIYRDEGIYKLRYRLNGGFEGREAFPSKEEAETRLKELQDKYSNKQHSIDITPQLKSEVEKGLPLFQKQKGKPKGALETLNDGKVVIHALESPDFSTLIHEIIHVFEKDLSGAEIATLEKWSGKKQGTRDFSEAFARAGERYFYDGKAPNEQLKAIFEKFRAWLQGIYQSVKGSPIEKKISPEVRKIFDRLIMGEEAPQTPAKGITTEGVSPKGGVSVPSKETPVISEPREGKRAGFEIREEEGVIKGSVEGRKDEIGKIVKDIVDNNPHWYKELHQEDAIKSAIDLINSFDSFESAYADLIKPTKDVGALPVRHVARQIVMQRLAQELSDAYKAGDKSRSDMLINKIVTIEDSLRKELTYSAQMVSMTLWKVLSPETTVYAVQRLFNDVNKSRIGFEAEQAEEFIKEWNKELPDNIKKILTENEELKKLVDKLEARIKAGKGVSNSRTTKAKAKELADKVRGLKSTNWGLTFADPVGAVAIMDGALEVTAKTIETTGNILQAINDGVSYIKSTDWYKHLTRAKQTEVEDTYRKKMRDAIEFDASEYLEGTSWWRKAAKAELTEEEKKAKKERQEFIKEKKKANERQKDQIYDIIASHWLVEKTTKETLQDRLMREVGLTKAEAEKIAKVAEESLKRDAQEVFDKTLSPKMPNIKMRKTAFERFFGLIKRGVLTDSNYYELFAEKYNLRPNLTEEQKIELKRLAINAELMQPYGYYGDLANNMFVQYMAKITEMDSWLARQSKLMISANYARMLSGVTTHWVNLKSAGANILVSPFARAINATKWFRVAKKLAKGDKVEAKVNNPLIDLYYAFGIPFSNKWAGVKTSGTYSAGLKIGWNQLQNIIKHGNIKEASKYLETVDNLSGQNIPELEKNKFGVGKRFKPIKVGGKDFNPFNTMKYVGRFLLGEDSQMFNVPFAHELALAARADAIRGGTTLSERQLREKLINEIQGAFLSEEQSKAIEEQLAEQTRMLNEAGIFPDKNQIKQRRFELTRSLLDLSEKTLQESTQMARGYIFTDARGGVFSQAGDTMGRWFNKNAAIKIATMPKIPFTGVLGRVADYSMDTMWGAWRAHGWSPTGIIARARLVYKTGVFKDFWLEPQRYDIYSSAQLGEKGSPRYDEQMARQWWGLFVLGLVASVFLADDDEDAFFDLTGALSYADIEKKAKHPLGSYTMKIGNFKLRYINLPIINMPLSLIGNYKDHRRAGEPTDELDAKLKLVAHSFLHSLTMIKDTWLAKGINDLAELITGVLNSIGKGEERREVLRRGEKGAELINIDPRVITQLENMRDDYTGLIIKYVDPLKSNLVQQIWKGLTPEGRLKGTGVKLWAYNFGLQNITNDKRTDIFGQTVELLPGDQGIAWPRDTDKRWEKMWKYNVNLDNIFPRDRVVVKGRNQTLEWNDYIKYRDRANLMFRDRFDKYFETTSEDELKKKADTEISKKTSTGDEIITNQVHEDLKELWNKAKEDARKELFTWSETRKSYPDAIKILANNSALPDFWNEKVKINKKEFILPYPVLEEINNNAMNAFLKTHGKWIESLKEKNLLEGMNAPARDDEKKRTKLQKSIDEKWNSALSQAKSKKMAELKSLPEYK